MFTLLYFFLFDFNIFLPLSIKSLNCTTFSSFLPSMQILYFMFNPSFIALSMASVYFSSYTTTSASLLFSNFFISTFVKALSSGIITFPAHSTPKYVTHHSYLLSPITAILFALLAIIASDIDLISSANFEYVISFISPFFLYLNATLALNCSYFLTNSLKFFIGFLSISSLGCLLITFPTFFRFFHFITNGKIVQYFYCFLIFLSI